MTQRTTLIFLIPLLFILSVASIIVLAFVDTIVDYFPMLAMILLLLFAFACLTIVVVAVLSAKDSET